MLVGRDRERHAIAGALSRARLGQSAILAFLGEPGIGKSALLAYAREQAHGMQILRARGLESEAQIPFASLLELVRPALGLLDKIPAPQATALEGALAFRPAAGQERFAIGAAVLSLLAAYAEQAPVAILLDDAQWLDGASSQALLFAFRRLIADPVAVLMGVREGEPSLLDGADLPTVRVDGLSNEESRLLLTDVEPALAERLYRETAGNPLALLELAAQAGELPFGGEHAPVVLSARISQAFLRRLGNLVDADRQTLVLAAASDDGDLRVLARAARQLAVDLSGLDRAQNAGLLSTRRGLVEFRHPLARSAIYSNAPLAQRRAAHRALAAAMPDRDVDRRAWHLAAAAVGTDEAASAALDQAAARARNRSAYTTAAAAFERAARLTADIDRRARLMLEAAEAGWSAGRADHAVALLEEARASTGEATMLLRIDELAGHIAIRRGPVMNGHAILTSAAENADPERAVAMLCEAANACFYAGKPDEMIAVAERASRTLPEQGSARTRFLAAVTFGMARIVGGDAAAGSQSIHHAIAIAESSSELRADPQLLPWLAIGPIFLREAGTGRQLVQHALTVARERAALGALPFLLNLVARDQATTDRWSVAAATYREAIDLARETDQQTDLAFSLSGLAWLEARRGHEPDCRALAEEALQLCRQLGTRLHEIWALAALGDLELGLGRAERAADHLERQRELLRELAITDADLSPAPELIDAYCRLGRAEAARAIAEEFVLAAEAKGQPWSLARAERCRALLADERSFATHFERAFEQHAQTADAFETARTQIACGERLRRARNRIGARAQLRAALETFERLDARPWADRARTELAATGERARRRDPTTIDELTPQELQIALQLASGKTTREAAAGLFLSPKTVEYHLRHVYMKLDIHSRAELAEAIGTQSLDTREPAPSATS
jgi:DNA-binding CsgD family transcriptional regulator/predicted ATPase